MCTLCWEGRCWQIAINESDPGLLIEQLEARARPPSKYLPKLRAKTGQRVLWPSQSITARGRRWLRNLPNPNSHFMTALLRLHACLISQPMKQSRISPSRFPPPQHTDFSSHLIDCGCRRSVDAEGNVFSSLFVCAFPELPKAAHSIISDIYA